MRLIYRQEGHKRNNALDPNRQADEIVRDSKMDSPIRNAESASPDIGKADLALLIKSNSQELTESPPIKKPHTKRGFGML